LEAIKEPLTITIRANTGPIPPGSWVLDPADGGGPIVGEACHYIDLACALTRSVPVRVHAEPLGAPAGARAAAHGPRAGTDAAITLHMASGSLATIVYATGGDKSYPRERVEVFGGGAACAIDNFRTMTWSRGGKQRRTGGRWTGVDRGHRGEMTALIE